MKHMCAISIPKPGFIIPGSTHPCVDCGGDNKTGMGILTAVILPVLSAILGKNITIPPEETDC